MSEGIENRVWGPFFSESPDPCVVMRLEEGCCVLDAANRAWAEATQLGGALELGRAVSDCLPPEVAATTERHAAECVRCGTVIERQEELRLPTGCRLWCTRYCPWPLGQQPTHVICMSRDLTDALRAASTVSDNEARFRRLAENAQDVIYRIRYEPEPRVEYVNAAIERMTGYPPSAFYTDASFWTALVHPDDRQTLSRFVRDPTPELKPIRCIHADGSLRWVEARNVCLHDENGRLVAVEGIARDVTHRKKHEEARSKDERQLLESQKLESLGVLAGGVAHDFNNLLTGILGRVSLMKHGVPASSVPEHIEEIEQATIQAADLCRQMLAYSGKGRFMLRRLDLNELVRETVPLLQVSIGKNAKLELHLGQELPAVAGDPAQFRQLLVNLVVNASEALVGGHGTVTIQTSSLHLQGEQFENGLFGFDLPPGRYVCLAITDTGSGMSPETRKRMFEPFFSTKFTGRGLGLPAVLGIVRGHRGAIRVDTHEDRGTTFHLMFPAVEGGSERAPASNSKGYMYESSGSILVIDDEEVVRSVTTRILQSVGFKVLSASDGIDGLARFRSHADEVAAVLLDLTMPGLDGEAVFRELRALRQDVPVLLMSGYNEQDAIARFAGKGLAGFLQKPFTMDQLLEKLRAVLPTPPSS